MSRLRNQSGQGVVEMVLLMAVTLGIAILIQSYFERNEWTQKLFGKPWAVLSGMIECGTWQACTPGKHPNNPSRVNSILPE